MRWETNLCLCKGENLFIYLLFLVSHYRLFSAVCKVYMYERVNLYKVSHCY
jgi:hypothetical protein